MIPDRGDKMVCGSLTAESMGAPLDCDLLSLGPTPSFICSTDDELNPVRHQGSEQMVEGRILCKFDTS